MRSRACILVQVTIYRRLGLVEMVISTNSKPVIYRNLYENTGPVFHKIKIILTYIYMLYIINWSSVPFRWRRIADTNTRIIVKTIAPSVKINRRSLDVLLLNYAFICLQLLLAIRSCKIRRYYMSLRRENKIRYIQNFEKGRLKK